MNILNWPKQKIKNYKLLTKKAEKLKYHERFVPLDHFYSPMVVFDKTEESKYQKIRTLPVRDINLNIEQQLRFLDFMISNQDKLPWDDTPKEGLKYYYKNSAFGHNDAITYYNILICYKPKKVIEIGSGFSSCVLFDTENLYFSEKIEKTFIEPYPALLKDLVGEDLNKSTLIAERLEDLDSSIFTQLERNDILFVDSTHVSKFGSDLNYIMFEILPRLKSGVIIHFHDIFLNFEYPVEWLQMGICWNENYILRAFLSNNERYKTLYFNNHMGLNYLERYRDEFEVAFKNLGASFWMQKV